MPGWYPLRATVELEFTQGLEEGRDPAALEALRREWEAAGDDAARLAVLHEKLLAVPFRSDFPFDEPSDLEGIRARADGAAPLHRDFSADELADKMLGAWLGRCAGCALGKPVEAYMSPQNGLASWERQKRFLTAVSAGEWPVRDYFPQHSPAEEETGPIFTSYSVREKIAYMESDDDIRYTVLGQIVLEKHGADFTTWDVARQWINQLPYIQVCTAETQAYRNLIDRYDFHVADWKNEKQDVDWSWVATRQNPYREWIGAQIRVDSYGYAAPGNPALAAEFAWRDARLSHVKNGIYGAMFCAAMIAASFATNDVRAIIEAGLAQIPRTSRLHAEMRQVIAICEKYGCRFDYFEKVIGDIYALLGHYGPVHTNNNAGLCVAALLLSGGDFSRGITLAVMGGWDTDCNGATVGSIVGAIAGGKNAPAHWTARLNDTLNSLIIGYHPIAISECARRSTVIAQKILTP